MKFSDARVFWNRGGPIAVEPRGKAVVSFLRFSGGASDADWNSGSQAAREARLFELFAQIVVRDRVPVDEAHAAFSAIDLYAERVDS